MHCAVLGSPIAHSLSPAMHRAAYLALGLDWTYEAVDVPAGGLAEFVSDLDDEWAGLSVTAPLKREASAYAKTRTDDVETLGVANTLVHGVEGWHAANTDIAGAVNAMAEHGISDLRTVRILGGGATAESMLLAVRRLGASSIEVVVRNPAKVTLEGVEVRDITEPVGPPVDLLVSTLPADAVGDRAAQWASAAAAVFDLSYHPWPTPLASVIESGRLLTGIDLLAHQGALQVELMSGHSVDPDLLRTAALAR